MSWDRENYILVFSWWSFLSLFDLNCIFMASKT